MLNTVVARQTIAEMRKITKQQSFGFTEYGIQPRDEYSIPYSIICEGMFLVLGCLMFIACILIYHGLNKQIQDMEYWIKTVDNLLSGYSNVCNCTVSE